MTFGADFKIEFMAFNILIISSTIAATWTVEFLLKPFHYYYYYMFEIDEHNNRKKETLNPVVETHKSLKLI